MTVNCPICIGRGYGERQYAGAPNLIVAFRMPDGSVHAGPDMWFASRAQRIEHGDVEFSPEMARARDAGADSVSLAMGQYAEMCGLLIAGGVA